MNERWREIPGYEDRYEVSDIGRVRSMARITISADERVMRFGSRLLSLRADSSDRISVTLRPARGAPRKHLVHRLVLLAFKGPCPRGLEGCHNDGNASNNRLLNLRWDTRQSNVRDVYIHGARGKDWEGTPLRKLSGMAFVSGYLSGLTGLI